MKRRFMELAIEVAEQGVRKGNSPFGSCIVKGDNVVCVAHNTVLTKKDATNHAEMNAIMKACKKLKNHELRGCVIYSTTEPCPMCFSAIHWAKMKTIVYGTNINDVKMLGFKELTISAKTMKSKGGSPIGVKGGFMRAECLELLGFWKKRKGKKTY